MLNGIEGIMHLAAASGEELGTTSDIVTDALTAFGMKAEESGRFADILAAAAANANTNVGMMGESFKYAAPVAGSLGYSAEDVAVALGLMANSGIKASMAGTSLRNMFNRMAKPTKESDAAMERLGISLQDDEGRMYSFREIMDQLRKSMTTINMPLAEYNRQLDILDEDLEAGRIKQSAYDKELEELNKQAFGAEGAEKARAAAMLGGTRAMAGLLAIANATEEDYNQLTNAIDNSSQAFARTKDGVVPLNEALASGAEVLETYEGSAAAMAATMLDNVEGQFTILKSQLSELAISLGDTLMPTLREVIGYIQDFVDKLNGMDEDTKKMIINIVLVTAALSPVLIIVGKLMTGIGSLMTVIGGLSAPILAVIAVIAALVAAFVHLWNTNDEFRENILKTWERIKTTFSEFGQGIVDRLNKMGFEFKDFGEVVGAVWNGLCSVLAPLFEVAFKTVGDILDASLKLLTGIFDFWVGLFSGDWEQMWNGLVETFEAIFGGLANIFDDILGGIVAGINGITSGIRKVSKGKIDIPEIKWMAEGGVLTNGTAIVGEAGAELLTVQNGQAVVQPLGSQSGTSELQSLLREYLPYLKMKQDIILDGDTLVGHTAPRMNEALGEIRSRETYA